jgi:hypothetical protein
LTTGGSSIGLVASGDLILFFSWRFKNAETILRHFLP